MKLNIKQKITHPQIKFIPDSIWCNRSLFAETLPDYLLPLMRTTEANLSSALNTILPHITRNQNKQCVWLAITYSHPQLGLENLLKIAKQLGMSDSLLFYTAAMAGNQTILRALEDKHAGTNWLKSIILFNRYKLFKNTAEHGQIEVLKYLVSKVPTQRQKIISLESKRREGSFFPKKIFVNTLEDMITSEKYFAHKWAVYYAHLPVIKYLEEGLKGNPDLLENMMASENYKVFELACEKGHLDIFKHLESKVSIKVLQEKIRANDFQLFRDSARYSNFEMLQYLAAKSSSIQLQEMIQANNYEAFASAAEAGDLNMLKFFENNAPHDLKKMIAANNYMAFIKASYGGSIEILDYFESKVSSKELEGMLMARDYLSFKWAALGGKLQAFEHLENKIGSNSKIFQAMLVSNNYEIFSCACLSGNLELIKHLENKVSSAVFQKMIKAQNYKSYSDAAQRGYLELMKYLESKVPKDIKKMNTASNYQAFRVAAQHHQLDVVKHLENQWPNLLKKMIKAENYEVFNPRISDLWREGLPYSNLEVVHYLLKKVPNSWHKIMASQGANICSNALWEGNLEMLRSLEGNARPGQMLAILKEHRPWFGDMVCPEVVKYIDQQLSSESPSPSIIHPTKKLIHHFKHKDQKKKDPNKLKYSLRYLETAIEDEQFEVVNYFLSNPNLFRIVSNQGGDTYSEYLEFFVQDQLVIFKQLSIKANQSHTVFDLQVSNDIALSFGMLQHLLRKNDASLTKDIQFLLTIPALKRYIKEQSQDIKKELWDFLAKLKNNKEIVGILAVILEKEYKDNPTEKLWPTNQELAPTKENSWEKMHESLKDSKPQVTGNGSSVLNYTQALTQQMKVLDKVSYRSNTNFFPKANQACHSEQNQINFQNAEYFFLNNNF